MGIYMKKSQKESVDRLISRFNKKVQTSRILLLAKEKRYLKKGPNKRHMRRAAIMRSHYRSQREKMKYY